ncbi:MAG: DsbA family protein [Actinomycetota bacterium]|nr:DsbA family protein [Actinomycetota bacterium]
MIDSPHTPLDELPGGPYDIEFFFDPGCPFAWQTSVWIRRVMELRDIKVGWRFISLAHINEGKEKSDAMREAHAKGRAYHRICAAARTRFGNEAVARLYRAYGERYWYTPTAGDDKFAVAARRVDAAAILAELDLPADLIEAADDDSWDELLALESDEAFRRTGPGVGTPIITYDPPHGNSLFGPVISTQPPDDETALAFFDAMRTFVDFPAFSELKRTIREPLDLPLLAD